MTKQVYWDPLLIQRYNRPGPRYTSYPTAVEFQPVSDDQIERQAFAARDRQRPLSLYLHIPFCRHVCYYCGCNKIVTRDTSRARPYLDLLKQEIDDKAALLVANDDHAVVEQMHLGGGTPTFLSDDELAELVNHLRQAFNFSDAAGADYSIEIDPRELRPGTLKLLRSLGFNRVSYGVQDVQLKVQQAVNRVQSEQMIRDVMTEARQLGFRSINIDLIYGLPHQTPESFDKTLDTIIDLRPDRLSVFNYAHLPERFKPQRRISEEDLPDAQQKLTILGNSIQRLTDAGYRYIGMDHFALPDDELAVAQAHGKLHRNFQGYTTHAQCDLIGFGVSSISQIGDYYLQNQVAMEPWAAAIEQGHLPLAKQICANQDDRIRRMIITELLCHLHINFSQLDGVFAIDSRSYLAEALTRLQPMQDDGLVTIDQQGIRILDRGQLLVRNACMAFDEYLAQHQQQRFSRAI